MSMSSGESSLYMLGVLTGEGVRHGGGRSELDLRRPREPRVRGGRTFVDEARCLLWEGGGARQSILPQGCMWRSQEQRAAGLVAFQLYKQNRRALRPRHPSAHASPSATTVMSAYVRTLNDSWRPPLSHRVRPTTVPGQRRSVSLLPTRPAGTQAESLHCG